MRACRKGQQNYSTGISEPLTAALKTRTICKTQLVQFPNHGGAEEVASRSVCAGYCTCYV